MNGWYHNWYTWAELDGITIHQWALETPDGKGGYQELSHDAAAALFGTGPLVTASPDPVAYKGGGSYFDFKIPGNGLATRFEVFTQWGKDTPGFAPRFVAAGRDPQGRQHARGLEPEQLLLASFRKQLCHQLHPHVRCESREERAEAVAGAGSRRRTTPAEANLKVGRRAEPLATSSDASDSRWRGGTLMKPAARPGSSSLETSSRSGEPVQYACQHFNPSRGQEARTSRLQRAWAAIVHRQNRSLTGSRGFPTCDFKGIPRKWNFSSRKCLPGPARFGWIGTTEVSDEGEFLVAVVGKCRPSPPAIDPNWSPISCSIKNYCDVGIIAGGTPDPTPLSRPMGRRTVVPSPRRHSFFQQELAHFSNDQRFLHDEHVVVRVRQFDDSRSPSPRCGSAGLRHRSTSRAP